VARDHVTIFVSDRHEVGLDEFLSPEEVKGFELARGVLHEGLEPREQERGLPLQQEALQEEAAADEASSLSPPSSPASSSSAGDGVDPAQVARGEQKEGDQGVGEAVGAGREAAVAAVHQIEMQVGHFAWKREQGPELITVEFSAAVYGADGRECNDYRITFLVASMHMEASIAHG